MYMKDNKNSVDEIYKDKLLTIDEILRLKAYHIFEIDRLKKYYEAEAVDKVFTSYLDLINETISEAFFFSIYPNFPKSWKLDIIPAYKSLKDLL